MCITPCSTWRSVSDEHPSSSLITATEADTSQENNGRTETFTAGLPVIRAQSDGSLNLPMLLAVGRFGGIVLSQCDVARVSLDERRHNHEHE
jgi:hypothetical protein